MEYMERTDSVALPKESGVDVLVKLIRDLIHEIPRVKEITITSNGEIRYTWYAPQGTEARPLVPNFEDVLPYSIIRNSRLREVRPSTPDQSILALFMACAEDHLLPIALVVGADSTLYNWWCRMYKNGGPSALTPSLFGYPILHDREVPDDVIILCASYARTHQLTDTYCCYKVTLEESGNE